MVLAKQPQSKCCAGSFHLQRDATIDGKSIVQNTQAVKQVINISPQETAVAPNLTVYENLLLFSQIYGYEKKKHNNKYMTKWPYSD